MTNGKRPVWFITGCSTGFGRELAKATVQRGWNVVATARQLEQVQDLVAGHEGNAMAIKLDVTNAEDINVAVAAALERFGRIDVLVNNAGYGYCSTIEEGENALIRAQFETNVFGPIQMIKEILPEMRKLRSGHIVNFSSIGGFIGFGGVGYYCATKFALEGLSEALASECKSFGVKVTIVEPGPFRTDFSDRSMVASASSIAEYAAAGSVASRLREGTGHQPGDPARAAEAVIAAVNAAESPARLVLGAQAVEMAKAKLEVLGKNFDIWKETSVSADFPLGRT
jgi:NAD(P)-dependent dehydrogenase (short-subunit alcohol dehydrogenase family)